MGQFDKAIRGWIGNVRVRPPLLLTFQWNPTSIKDTRPIKYKPVEVGGYPAPLQIYHSGGKHLLQFDLLFDATPTSIGVDGYHFRIDIPGVGVAGSVAVIRSFTYPEFVGGWWDFQETMFNEPPDAYLGFGAQFILKGRIEKADVVWQVWDKALTPTRAKVTVAFSTDEFGGWGQYEILKRKILVTTAAIRGG